MTNKTNVRFSSTVLNVLVLDQFEKLAPLYAVEVWDCGEGEVIVLNRWFLYVGKGNLFGWSTWGMKWGTWLPNTAVPYSAVTIRWWISSLGYSFCGSSAMRLSFLASISQMWAPSFLTFSCLTSVVFLNALWLALLTLFRGNLHFPMPV